MSEKRYRDFDDLRANRAAEIRADIAVDLEHPDPPRLDEAWAVAADGEFRLSLTQAVADHWERILRETAAAAGRPVPDDHFAIEIVVDSYADAEMGHTLLLELHAYCGSEELGELCWDVFDDAAAETRFCREFPARVLELLGARGPVDGLACTVELTEVQEL